MREPSAPFSIGTTVGASPSSGLFTGDDGYDLYDLNYKDPEAPDETRAESLCYLFQKLSER